MTEPACEWATCSGAEAEPGSLYCKPHGRQARQEGTPWRRPGSAHRLGPLAAPTTDELEAALARPPLTTSQGSPAPPLERLVDFTKPPPAAPPARPLQPPQATCRLCDEPPLERTLTSRSNRWRNLCERHYAEARNALGPARRAQLAEVAGIKTDRVRARTDPVRTIDAEHAPRSYAERASELFELGAAVDDAAEQLAGALTRWRNAVKDLA